MQLTYLIKNSDTKKRFETIELPNGVMRGAVGSYKANGGQMHLLSFSTKGATITGARVLSRLRDMLCEYAGSRVLVDDASLKFVTTLYPRFAEYERKLRCAITLATCAELDNFDDGLVSALENLTLSELGNRLFYDRSLQDKVKNKVKDNFTKAELSEFIVQLTENTVWASLFEDESLNAVYKNYWSLCKTRNKVMHQRLITEKQYDNARKMLRESIDELDSYTERILSDINYPKRYAERAVNAAKVISEHYENLCISLKRFAEITSAVQDIPNIIDASGLTSLARIYSEILEPFNANQALMKSLRSIPDLVSAVQTSNYASAIESIEQQIQLPKLMSKEDLSDLVKSATSVD